MKLDREARLTKALLTLIGQKNKLEKKIAAVRASLRAIGVASSPLLRGRRHRQPMTAAERRSVSARMKH
jgi:hypothetical protein